jgi:hypothetical protein
MPCGGGRYRRPARGRFAIVITAREPVINDKRFALGWCPRSRLSLPVTEEY